VATPRRRSVSVLVALALAGGSISVLPVGAGRAATPEPTLNPDITITAEPMLGGSFRTGSWAAVRVHVENAGPTIVGELRISNTSSESTYGIPIELATGARQEHLLYGRTGPFGSRFLVTVVSGGAVIASINSRVDANESGSLQVYVVADRPEALVTSIRGAVTSPDRPPPVVVAIGPEDLPPRVEAWASVDRLIWQDIDSSRLDADQLEALRTWISSGGQLVILGGTTGSNTLGAFPADLLPYQPTRVIDAPTADLEALLGALPPEATPIPAIIGPFERGTVLARSGDDVIAGRTTYGQGSLALIGIDPTTTWIAGSAAADTFWARALPSGAARTDPAVDQPDDAMVSALSNLPSVQLPRMDQLFLLILGYIVVLGPLNYILLRRRDRGEWAWITMPAVIVVFAVAAYLFGVTLKGANVIVNELAIVRGSAGTDRGLAEVHVGVFSPGRNTFDVKVGGGALLSGTTSNSFGQGDDRPLDVLLGETATLRGYSVGFGVLRGFQAEAAVSTPRVDADLRLVGEVLEGTVTNASDAALAQVGVVFGNGVQVLGAMAPGEARPISIAPGVGFFGQTLADQLLAQPGSDLEAVRAYVARRAMIQHLTGGFEFEVKGGGPVGQTFARGPVILAFRSGSTLDIDVGTPAERVGETLFVLPARAVATGPVVFTGGLISHTVVDVNALDSFDQGFGFGMGRGTMTVEFRPIGVDGVFDVSGLAIRLGREESEEAPGAISADGSELEALPAEDQPDPDDPLASDPQPGGGQFDVPLIQLFDRVGGTWVEFERATPGATYRIADVARYVDATGAFRVRFVVRNADAFIGFSMTARLEGNAR
jgi:hypothetical protein